MARQRAVPGPSAAAPYSRKRQHAEEDDVHESESSTKRRISGTRRDASRDHDSGGRAASPFKNVHFKRTLEQGPTKSAADHRHRIPKHSALRRKDGEYGDGRIVTIAGVDILADEEKSSSAGSEEGPASADAQLHEEMDGDILHRAAQTSKGSVSGSNAPHSNVRSSHSGHDAMESDVTEIDAYICGRLQDLQRLVGELASTLPDVSTTRTGLLDRLMKPQNAQLIRYIGCLSLSGPEGKASWQQLIQDNECRRALVWGIIGRALKESVFRASWFGGTEDDERKLSELEQRSADKDGFQRTKERADVCRTFRVGDDPRRSECLSKAKAKLVIQLEQVRQKLSSVVRSAVVTSHRIRHISNAVYYWPPTFKDEEFEPARMECLNVSHMIETSPYTKKEIHGRHRAVLQEGHEAQNEAIVRVVCFPGLIAYRKGGGELAKQLLRQEGQEPNHAPPDVQYVQQTRDGKYTGLEGFRTRVVCKAVVHLLWGKQRLLMKEAGTSAYLDAMRDHSSKYKDNYVGLRELWDIFLETTAAKICENCKLRGHVARECRVQGSSSASSRSRPVELGRIGGLGRRKGKPAR